MHHHPAREQFGQDFFGRHGGIQFVFARMDLAIGCFEPAQNIERNPASDEMLAFQQACDLLIGASLGNDDDLSGGLLRRANDRPLAPSKDLVSRRAGETQESQKP